MSLVHGAMRVQHDRDFGIEASFRMLPLNDPAYGSPSTTPTSLQLKQTGGENQAGAYY